MKGVNASQLLHLEVMATSGWHCVQLLGRCKCNMYNVLASVHNITLTQMFVLSYKLLKETHL